MEVKRTRVNAWRVDVNDREAAALHWLISAGVESYGGDDYAAIGAGFVEQLEELVLPRAIELMDAPGRLPV